MADTRAHPDVPRVWRMRWWLLVACSMSLASLLSLVATEDTGWRWSLFAWGVAISLAGIAVFGGVVAVARHLDPGLPPSRPVLRRALVVYAGCWLYAGLIAGTAAAEFDMPWLVIGLAIYEAVAVVVLVLGGLWFFKSRGARDG